MSRASSGEYKKLFSNVTSLFDAYDSAPFSENKSHGIVKHLDLSVPQYGLRAYDWIICSEFGEHTPMEFEDVYLDNIVRHARVGVIIDRSAFDQQQNGDHAAIEKLRKLCFEVDLRSTERLRKASGNKNFHVLRRRATGMCLLDELNV